MASRADRPDIRKVYAEAWADRVATGDTSDEVLLRRLRLNSMFLQPNQAGGLDLILGWWHRGVPPSRLNWEIALTGGRLLKKVGLAYWSVAQALRGSWSDTVPFEASIEPDRLSGMLREAGYAEGGGASYEVWFDVRTTAAPTALVMFGDDVVGRTQLDASEWAELRTAAGDDWFAAGFLCVEDEAGQLRVDSLEYEGLSDDEEVPFDPALSPPELSDLLAANCDVEDGYGDVEVWFDVRSTVEPEAMVMLSGTAIGRSVLPRRHWPDLVAAAESDQFAEGTLDVVEIEGLLTPESLLFEGVDED